ncbi:metal ABC transporter permease [Thermohalobacter berrensis]|uniref:Metal ABC transporter permease n=1 Tax=Thermohalobacter berrensis TaxID=99594 RepID=A0A419SWH2_9FIRM|nr:metal ABC transporter permease [Thermohalobacter berrensis]RKD29560.1 hypothetical protein BET03_05740 [Thermohalobacter berrensis]
MIKEFLEYNFLQNALISAILASIVCGIIGTIIIEKRLVMMSGGIAHTSFGGIGLGYLLGIEPIIGGLLFAILAALGITSINKKTRTNSDALIGMFWAVGMALGIIFIALTPGYPPDLTSYLFGDILAVSKIGIKLMIVLDLIIGFIIVSLYNYWKAFLFDEEFLKVLGIKVTLLEYLLFILIALAIVVLIKVVGIILVIALLTIPPSVAKFYTYDFKKLMILATLLGIVFCILGLIISYQFNIPSGATIIIVSAIVYLLGSLFKGGNLVK